jgi:hypothetical protein
LLRSGKAAPAMIAQMERDVADAQHFYDSVCERAERSGDHAEVQALFNHRLRRLANDLPAYQQQVEAAKL